MRTFKQLLPLAVAFAALATAGPALAERGRVFSSSFGEGQLSLTAGTELSPGSGLAVDQSTHDVYVTDTANHRVDEFSASGVFIRAWGWGVSDGAAKAEVCTSSCRAGIAGTAPGQFDTPTSIAIDEAPGGEGDVYVGDYAEFGQADNIVQKFSSEGTLITAWGEGGQLREGTLTGGEELHGIGGLGVNSAGDLWVGSQTGLFELERSDAYIQRVRSGEYLSRSTIIGLSLDPGDDVFLDAVVEAHKFDSSGGNVGQVYESSTPSTGLAVDQASGELLYDEGSSVATVAPSCVASFSSPCPASSHFGPPQLGTGAGLAVDSQSGTVYVADTENNRIDTYIPEPATTPKIEEESLQEATATGASFTAQINPRSVVGEGATEYEFQYGLCASAESCPETYEHAVPVPAGTIAPGFDPEAVSAHASGLSPKSVYHFRVVARNSHNQENEYALGKELTFTTEGLGGELTLPDGRAWELVSPPDKLGASIEPITEAGVVQAAVDGSGITYLANAPTEPDPQGTTNEVQVLSTRQAGGWSSRDLSIPHASATGKPVGEGLEYKAFDEDLTTGVVTPFGLFNPGLSTAATESTAFLHSLTTPAEACTPTSSCYVPLVTRANDTTDPFQPFGEESLCQPGNSTGTVKNFCGPEFLGASEDLAHVVMRANRTELLAGAGSGQLYEWSDGSLTRVSVLPGPDEEPAKAPQLGLTDRAARHAVSEDGRFVFWTAQGRLYVRDTELGESGETLELDLPEAGCGGCGEGGGSFQGASADGSKVFFGDRQRLTANSGASTEAADLYECELTVSAGKLACGAMGPIDLTPKHGEEDAAVRGGILGAGEDGEWVYFAANGVLSEAANARGEVAQPGDCGGESSFIEGVSCNLYVSHAGSTSFIARLSGLDGTDWAEGLLSQPTRVSPDGEWLEFMSAGSPTGYDNRDAHSGAPAAEVYLYDAKAGKVICASCLPSGARPTGIEYKRLEPSLVAGSGTLIWSKAGLVAANVPGWTAIASGGQQKELYQPRYLTDSGRLFFDSGDRLVPQDSNGTQDVYEYEPAGIKGPAGNELCTGASETFSAASGGCVSLISSGSSGKESAFLGASATGGDVFFLTSARLTSQDIDSSRDVYDAHECSSESPCVQASNVQSPPCTNEASCKASPTPQPAIFGAPSSATFQGPGNLASAAVVKAKAKSLTRAQKLTAALKSCRKKPKKQRAGCEAKARKRYGPIKKAKKKSNSKGSK